MRHQLKVGNDQLDAPFQTILQYLTLNSRSSKPSRIGIPATDCNFPLQDLNHQLACRNPRCFPESVERHAFSGSELISDLIKAGEEFWSHLASGTGIPQARNFAEAKKSTTKSNSPHFAQKYSRNVRGMWRAIRGGIVILFGRTE